MEIPLTVRFYDRVDDDLLKFAVIVSKHRGKWVYCRHRERDTYEVPGGHREEGETIEEAVRRELFEETGALEYTLDPVSVYSVDEGRGETYGMLYAAEIDVLGALPESEIGEVRLFDALPGRLTYPQIQPALFQKAKAFRR